jgi:perosamine synthetase
MIPIAAPHFAGNEMAYVADCIRSGWVSSKGPYVQRFEEGMAAWCGVRHGIATSSGTNALHLALLACGIGPGDEVVVPALSYVASANAVSYTGAVPVFVDVNMETWNLDPTLIEHKITPRTKAIMAVHLYGHPLDMNFLCQIAQNCNLYLIEDACQAHGSEYEGKRVGGIGDIGCFSFYGNKLITTGEGGMIVTNSDALADTVRLLRNQGTENGSYWHPRLGFSYRMTNLQAAVGLAQLERVNQFVAAREQIARHYTNLLANLPGLTFFLEPDWGRSVCWLFSFLVKPESGLSRDRLIEYLKLHEIESKPFFQVLPNLPVYHENQCYPVAEHLSRCGISLPTSTNLQPDQIAHITTTVREAFYTIQSPLENHAYLSRQPGF